MQYNYLSINLFPRPVYLSSIFPSATTSPASQPNRPVPSRLHMVYILPGVRIKPLCSPNQLSKLWSESRIRVIWSDPGNLVGSGFFPSFIRLKPCFCAGVLLWFFALYSKDLKATHTWKIVGISQLFVADAPMKVNNPKSTFGLGRWNHQCTRGF